MDELKQLLSKYPNQSFLIVLALSLMLIWSLALSVLSIPLKIQDFFIEKQIRHLRLLKQLPSNWQMQAKATDITDLLAILTSQWQTFFPNKKNVTFNQVNQNQLKMQVKNIDEQALMQWIWAMQKQYAFKIVSLRMSKFNQVGIVNAQIVLQII
jgi:hypothetical protein